VDDKDYERLEQLLEKQNVYNTNNILGLYRRLDSTIEDKNALLRSELKAELKDMEEILTQMRIQIDRNSRVELKVYTVCTVIFGSVAAFTAWVVEWLKP
jgi:hypothetical protein